MSRSHDGEDTGLFQLITHARMMRSVRMELQEVTRRLQIRICEARRLREEVVRKIV